MVELADGHVDTTHTTNGSNITNKNKRTQSMNESNNTNGVNGLNHTPRKRIVVVGLGMVAVAFIEKLMKRDVNKEYHVTVVGEEPYVAYNRVGLSTFFEHRMVEDLYLNPIEWYSSFDKESFRYILDTSVTEIRTDEKSIRTSAGATIPYDILVLVTGSDAILPKSIPGYDANGVFLYRTILDLQHLIDFSNENKGTAGVTVGGGLLGLEAAKAMMDLEAFSSVKVVEKADRLLAKQLDLYAAHLVEEKVQSLGLEVMAGRSITSINVDENNNVTGATLENGETIECSTICFAIGVRARDDLAKTAQIMTGERTGGFVVDEKLQTSVDDIYAIGDCACWHKQTFGIIAPGVEMADVLSTNLTTKSSPERKFDRPDLSTKLKLLGIDVASFGDFFADTDGPSAKGSGEETVKALAYRDPFGAVYKKYLFTPDGKRLVGGMMIGDTRDYVKLTQMVRNRTVLEVEPSQFILGAMKEGEDDGSDLTDDTQVCSCHNVTKGDIVETVKSGKCKTLDEVKACTKAGTGCGGCIPLVQSILNRALKDAGQEVSNHLCPHFACSRADLYNIIAIKQLKTFGSIMKEVGTTPHSLGCEVCQPTVASILSSLFNDHVMSRPHHKLQETNDRFMANIQRNGTFSVVPRVPGGEVTPRQLIVMGQVAEKYGLYCKVTGGQRIDLFGAKKEDLLDIWREFVDAGMESGHAYAKALRTVKSCVGTNWCRYGVGDSVGMAIRLEERYKSIRAPHKIKGGVSGCVRECAEAQSKDFGLIATEKGFNIFIGGNGGAKPRHAELLVKDVPAEDVVPILDRYLIFYIRTADRLQRTARWIEGLPGGIKYLREVILDDKLGICADMERQMQELVDSYFDEWAEILKDPVCQGAFKQFNNTEETSETVEIISERGQDRPANWPKESPTEDFKNHKWTSLSWEPLIRTSHFDNFSSAQVKRGDTQLAVFKVKGKFYATQQMCPHKRAFVLSDGMVCENGEKFYVSCPLHKRNFELNGEEAGRCLSDESMSVATFKVESREDGWVYLELPPVEELDVVLGTERWKTREGEARDLLERMDQKLNGCAKRRRARKPEEMRTRVVTTHSIEW